MELTLKRISRKPTYTIGRLYIGGQYFCDTLEPTDRGLSSDMRLSQLKRNKVAGKTAIPTGRYKVDMRTVSPRFRLASWAKPYGGVAPRLVGVPCFSGVLIHVGNTEKDTQGCILIGRNKTVGKVLDSVETYKALMDRLLAAKDEIWITIA